MRSKANSDTPEGRITKLLEDLEERQKFMQSGGLNPVINAALVRSTKRLKLVCGWSVPDTQIETLSEDMLKAISLTQRTMFLGLYKYEVDFLEEGQVSLRLDFHSSMDAVIRSKQASVLEGEASSNRKNRKCIYKLCCR